MTEEQNMKGRTVSGVSRREGNDVTATLRVSCECFDYGDDVQNVTCIEEKTKPTPNDGE